MLALARTSDISQGCERYTPRLLISVKTVKRTLQMTSDLGAHSEHLQSRFSPQGPDNLRSFTENLQAYLVYTHARTEAETGILPTIRRLQLESFSHRFSLWGRKVRDHFQISPGDRSVGADTSALFEDCSKRLRCEHTHYKAGAHKTLPSTHLQGPAWPPSAKAYPNPLQ